MDKRKKTRNKEIRIKSSKTNVHTSLECHRENAGGTPSRAKKTMPRDAKSTRQTAADPISKASE
jgi:hypothetical protein